MVTPPRSLRERQADTRAVLGRTNHLWIATASADGQPHLVPVSFAWLDGSIVIATGVDTATGRNLLASHKAKLAIGATDDVILVDVELAQSVPVQDAGLLAERYAEQSDWDPRDGADVPTRYFVLRPARIQAWRDNNEVPGRTLMRGGAWLD